MDRDALRTSAIRYGLLFAISVILVVGFWFHREFYQIGFGPLVVIGGVVTFVIILAVRALGGAPLGRGRVRGSLSLPRASAERVLSGTQTLAILPVETEVPPAGSLTRVLVGTTKQPMAHVRIRDVRRRLTADVREEEASAGGYDGLDEFRKAWARGLDPDPRDLVLLVELRKEAKG
ncbi:MAG: hypothetical protein E6K18_04720 [Methanobacteriota archaeon]|nr:MAG: hypothetical protein E6K18_04720 [Euryarchaeota archaeon]